MTNGAPMDIFQRLVNDLGLKCATCSNAIVNRLPDSHTLLQLCAAYPFSEAEDRFRSNTVFCSSDLSQRLHPWGLPITFIKPITTAPFWSHEFTRCAPEIERLFESGAISMLRAGVSWGGCRRHAGRQPASTLRLPRNTTMPHATQPYPHTRTSRRKVLGDELTADSAFNY